MSEKLKKNEDVAATSTASIPSPAQTSMGPRFTAHNVMDRRNKKKSKLLKKFRRFIDSDG